MMSKEIEAISIGKDVEPITETQPPLVIDLPEGQKMVVGKLDPETVIEVATWRGTGRPLGSRVLYEPDPLVCRALVHAIFG